MIKLTMSRPRGGHVILLGAGFLMTVNSSMPSAQTLGLDAYELARQSDPGLLSDSPPPSENYPFEVWLSLLAGVVRCFSHGGH